MSQYLLIYTKHFELQIFIGFFNGVRKVVSCHNFGDQCVVFVVCQNFRTGIKLTEEETVIMIIQAGLE